MYKIAINRAAVGKPPLDTMTPEETEGFFRQYNARFQNETLSAREIIKLVAEDGFGIAAWHNGYRKRSNWLAGQHLGLDFDSGKTLEWALQEEFFVRNGAFLYTTPSHTEEQHRFRVIFLLTEPVEDADVYAELAQALVGQYDLADQSCKDPSRLFFGSKDAFVHIFGKALARSKLDPFVSALRAKREVEKTTIPQRSAQPVSEPRAIAFANSLLDHVAAAPDGQKHHTLVRIARTMGGYGATGLWAKPWAISAMMDALRRGGGDVKNWKMAEKTAMQMYDVGTQNPLVLADRPDTTDREKAAYAIGYQDGAAGDAPWEKFGLTPQMAAYLGVHWGTVSISEQESARCLAWPLVGEGGERNTHYVSVNGKGEWHENHVPAFFVPEMRDGPMLVLKNEQLAVQLFGQLGLSPVCIAGYAGMGEPKLGKEIVYLLDNPRETKKRHAISPVPIEELVAMKSEVLRPLVEALVDQAIDN